MNIEVREKSIPNPEFNNELSPNSRQRSQSSSRSISRERRRDKRNSDRSKTIFIIRKECKNK